MKVSLTLAPSHRVREKNKLTLESWLIVIMFVIMFALLQLGTTARLGLEESFTHVSKSVF